MTSMNATLRPLLRSITSIKAAPPAAKLALPCTCKANKWRYRLQSTQASSTAATAAEQSTFAGTSSSSSTGRGAASPSISSSIAQESFRRQQQRSRPLPVIKDQRLLYLGVAASAITAWTFFVLWAMSAEKAASSVVRTLTFNLRSSPVVKEALGEGVRPKPFFIGSEPWVHGKVNTIQGIVDINFKVQSNSGQEGTVYFKSERRHKHGHFQTVDFKLVIDGKPPQVIDLKDADLLGLQRS